MVNSLLIDVHMFTSLMGDDNVVECNRGAGAREKRCGKRVEREREPGENE